MRTRILDLIFGRQDSGIDAGDLFDFSVGPARFGEASVTPAPDASPDPQVAEDLASPPATPADPQTADDTTPDPQPSAELTPAPAEVGPRSASSQSGDPSSISVAQILIDRPDVFKAFYTEFHGRNNDQHSTAWMTRVGGETAEAYAAYWYNHIGKYEGYSQGPTTAQDNVSIQQILSDRPDVLKAYYAEFYGPNNDRHSDAWIKRVGGDTPEAYAKYWYEKFGKWEGYSQTDKAAAENVNVEQILTDRPDVFRAYYTEFYGPNNDRHSSAWVNRVGGDTIQDYAKYWYVTSGKYEGYTQKMLPQASGPADNEVINEASDNTGVSTSATDMQSETRQVHDPSLDPWNHPAINPDAHPPADIASEIPHAASAVAIVSIGMGLGGPDLFG